MTRASQPHAFRLLGVKPTDDVAEIRKAWRRLVRTYHPDTYRGDKALANAKLAQLNAAFDALKDYTQADVEAARREEAEIRAEAARKLEAARRRSEAARLIAEMARQQDARRMQDAAARRQQAARSRSEAPDAQADALRDALRPVPAPEATLSERERTAASHARSAFAAARQVFDLRRTSRLLRPSTYA